MKSSVAAALLLLYGAHCLAEDTRAVQGTTFDGGLNFEEVKSNGDPNHTAGGLAAVTFGLGSYLGASLSAAASHTNIEVDRSAADSSNSTSNIARSCGFNSANAEGGLFLRNPSIGRIGASFGFGTIHSDCSDSAAFLSGDNRKLQTRVYSAEGELYLSQFTLGASYSSTHLDGGGDDIKSELATLSWYPVSELKISPNGGRVDGSSTYGITLEGQPEFLGDAVSVLLSYSIQRTTPDIKGYSIGFVYHFGQPLELQTRDRHYR